LKENPNKPDITTRQHSKRVEHRQESVQISSGPLPSPEILGLYERVSPGLAAVIVASFEAQYKHRQDIERVSINGDIQAMQLQNRNHARGQWLGFIITMFGLSLGSALVYLGHDWAGGTIAAGGLASVVAAFLRGQLPGKADHT
jgi:uncharacterized membrane protein